MRRAFPAALGLGGALLAAAAAGGDAVPVQVGGERLHIPEAWLEQGPQAFWEQALEALGLPVASVNVRIPGAEMAAVAPDFPASTDGRGGFVLSISGDAAGRRFQRHRRERAERVWRLRDEFEGAEVRRHPSGLYLVRPRHDFHWVAARMRPNPERPLPPELLAADCYRGEMGLESGCHVQTMHRQLLVSFSMPERSLHLLDLLRVAAAGWTDSWREAP